MAEGHSNNDIDDIEMAEEEDGWEYYDDNDVLPDFWQDFITNENDFAQPLDMWLRHFTKPFENAYGWCMYREYWRVWVPLLLAPRHGTTSMDSLTPREEARVKSVLIDPLEQFICGTENTQAVWRALSEDDAPAAVCGHVFKHGETCYSCRDCGQDATCVLCVDCFMSSEHKKHRFKMATSDGGGYCDCGDPEAFRNYPHCSIHKPNQDNSLSPEQVLKRFPSDLRSRAADVLYNIIRYCLDIVTDPKAQYDLNSGLKEKELFPDLKFPLQYSNNCCVLLNDENHSYMDVIRVLEKVLPKVAPKLATDLTTYVDKYGKAVIRVGSAQECHKLSDQISALTRISHATVLKSKVVSSYIVAHQEFVARLLNWLPSLFEISSGFRALFSEIMFTELSKKIVIKKLDTSKVEASTLCQAALLNDFHSWKQVRNSWLSLIIGGLMKDYESKRQLSVVFADNYPEIVDDYFRDDQEYRDASIMTLSVQIFTVPSLALYLVEQCDAMSKLIQGFLGLLEENKEIGGMLNLSPWLHDEKNEFQRGLQSLMDMTYLLAVVPEPGQWNNKLRDNFKSGGEKVLEVVAMMQGMDRMKRQVGQHVEMEDTIWKLTYDLQRHFSDIVQLVTNWTVSDKSVLIHMIEESLRLITLKHEPSNMKEISKYLAFIGPPRSYDVIEHDVSKQHISLHVPLHRFLINILMEAPRLGIEMTLKARLENCLTLSQLVEPVLQTVVAVAQISVGMWRRNGTAADSQAFIYNSKKYCPGVKDADLMMLQLVAAFCDDIDSYLVSILAKFKLAKWATGDIDTETVSRSEDFVEHCNSLADQWLGLMIAMTSERYVSGIGFGMNERSGLRREVIQLLCKEPVPHSAIVKRFPTERKNEKELDDVLKEVAVLKTSSKAAGKKVYHLKDGLESEYNMFYYGYSKEEQTAAQEHQLQSRSKAGSDSDSCPPPRMIKLTRMMSGLVRVLQSDVMLQAALVTLRRAADRGTGKSKYVTERQIHKVLYLIALGIQEQNAETEHCQFVERAASAGVFEQISKVIHDTNNGLVPEHVRKLGSWILKQYKSGDNTATAMETDENTSEAAETERLRKRRAEAAAARRAKIMAQMNAAQKNFAAENKVVLDEMNKDEKHEEKKVNFCSSEPETVCLGPGLTSRADTSHNYTCILCQEESVIGGNMTSTMVLASFVVKSTVLSQGHTCDDQPRVSPHHLDVSRGCGPHVSTCGHAMHVSCYQKFFSTLVRKEQERNNSFGIRGLNIDVTDGEFLCPICERLSNTVLPLLPSVTQVRKKQASMPASEISFNSFVNGLRSTVDSWYLKEDKEGGPAMHRIALKTTFDEQSRQNGPEFSQYFRGIASKAGDEGLFDETMVSMMNVFSMAIFTNSLELNPYEDDYRVPLVSLQAAAFTLTSLERLLALEDKPLFGSLNPRDEDCVRNLTRYIAMFSSSYSTEQGGVTRVQVRNSKNSIRLQFLQSNAMFLLSTILCKVTPDDANPLQLDAFGVLVSLIASLPCLFISDLPPRLPSGQGLELHCVKLCLLLHIVQVIHSFDLEDYKKLQGVSTRSEENLLADSIISKILTLKKIKVDHKRLSLSKIYARLEKDVLAFLRTSALLFQHFTDVLPGKTLAQEGGFSYGPLAKYLGLPPTIKQLLDNPASGSVMSSLLAKELSPNSDEELSQLTLPKFPLNFRRSTTTKSSKHTYPLSNLAKNVDYKFGLIPLPRDYTDLMNMSGNFSCPNSLTGESKTPTLCLVCGAMVCSHSHCCETIISGHKCGGCTSHARCCGADVGIFLRIRECLVVIHSKVTRGTFLSAPYIDEYGETDKGLRRGNPMYLDQEKYEELNRMWLRNEIPEKIARMFDPDMLLYFEWHPL